MNDPSPLASLLIVEDSRIQARILSDKLIDAGYEVRTAENGEIGLKMIREQPPTLVISDIEMPVMTGYELCHAVKNAPDLRGIPFILLSTLGDAQDIIKGLHCGADNYVTKPYDPEFLISRVASLLETPIEEEEQEQQLDVTLGGTKYTVKAGRQQILNLLVSTFENAVEKNHELVRTNEELTVAREQLTRWNEQLESLNHQLDSSNQRMTRDLNAAAKVQQSLLPSSRPKTSLVNFSWQFIPCDELAGDFLNYFALDEDHIAIYVVDVSGHGVASSLLSVTIGRLMTPLVSASSLLIQSDVSGGTRIVPPREVAYELNRRFPMEEQNELFFTMLYGVLKLSTLEFQFVSAGHDPVVHVPKGKKPRMVEGCNMAIGWVADMEYDQEVVMLAPGDRLYAYSDGVPEAMDEDLNQFSMQQMMEMIELGQSQSLDDSVSLLQKSVQRWCAKNGPKDDVSILGLEISSDR
ncbi:SpoIIE family protein phosphatase [Novipirellula artificiosorum]|nr:SpoIIE family protein phosphatase [Novipirellula artificiosorum]